MEWALSILKAIAGLALAIVFIAFFRACLRVFNSNRTFSVGFLLSLAVGAASFVLSGSIYTAVIVGSITTIVLYIIWLVRSFIQDTTKWRESRSIDTYQSYSDYLRLEIKTFRKRTARKLARKRLKEQISFFTLLRHKTDTPLGEIPLALGNFVTQRPMSEQSKLVLNVTREVKGFLAAYSAALKNRDKENQNYISWRKELDALEASYERREEIDGYDSRLSKAKAQVQAHQSLIDRQYTLLDPQDELSDKGLNAIESRLEDVMQRAFNFLIPSGLLSVVLSEQPSPENSSLYPSMSLYYKVHPVQVSGLRENSDPPKQFSYIQSKYEWHVTYTDSAGRISEKIELNQPTKFRNKYGIKRTYAYFIARAYADFAWELLKSMGFVSKASFDSTADPIKQSSDYDDLLKEFKSEFEGVLEGELINIASSGVAAAWIMENEKNLNELSHEIEDKLAKELDEFFNNSLNILSTGLLAGVEIPLPE